MWEIGTSKQHRIIRALLAALLLLGFVILFFVPPANLPLPACAFRSITGHSCLTCGMTRSLHAISHGEWAVSIRYHLFGPAVLIGMLLCFIIFAAEAIRGKRSAIPIGRKAKVQAFCVFAFIWVVYWGARLAGEFG
jgi:hypothetical protein